MITITGATGQLGGLIINDLLKQVDAAEVTAVARSPQKAAHLADKGVVVRQGDYEDSRSLIAAFQGADALMFISNTDFSRRLEQHQHVVDAAKEAGVGRIVYTSIIATAPDNPLVASHLQTEQFIKESGLPYTIIRPNFYMDYQVAVVEDAINKGVHRSASGEGGAAYLLRSDIARMATAVLTQQEHAGKTYELTGPSVVTAADVAAAASVVSGKNIPYQPISWDELAQDYKESGMPEQMVQFSLMIAQIIASNILAKVSDDIGTVTGTPATSFMDFIKDSFAQKT